MARMRSVSFCAADADTDEMRMAAIIAAARRNIFLLMAAKIIKFGNYFRYYDSDRVQFAVKNSYTCKAEE